MEIDLNKYLPTFIEESVELIQVMEDILLKLNVSVIDIEQINQIFRSVHTLKSSSAAFNFNTISEFSHTIETFLNPVRRGEKPLSQEEYELLLKSVDCLRSMISNVKDNLDIDNSCAISISKNFVNPTNNVEEKNQQADEKEQQEVDYQKNNIKLEEKSIWKIYFKPNQDLFVNGNDPLHVFKEFAEIGDFTSEAIVEKLPNFSSFIPEKCYLSWNILLKSDISITKVEEIINWISTVDEYEISPIKDTLKQTPTVSTLGQEPENTVILEKNTEISPLATTLRINTDKLDKLINLIGELVITQSMLNQIAKDFSIEKLAHLKEGLSLLEHNCRELQEEAMEIRLLPIATVLNRFPRMVHELAKIFGKQVNLVVLGEQTELDRSVIEKIIDPLGHLIRNSIDHGIEMPETRISLGKPVAGTITINTYQSGGSIIINLKDDGAGFNDDAIYAKALNLGLISADEKQTAEKIAWIIVQPGFSTANQITEVSGRGVGMDVVNKNIQELGGSLDISSVPGAGATFSLRLPLTLLIMDCQLIQICEQIFIIPLISMIEILKIEVEHISYVDGEKCMYYLRSRYIPIIYLANILGFSSEKEQLIDKFLIVVDINNQLYGLVCDEVLSQQQIVIKSLEENLYKIPGVSGATILGDGSVALIADVHGIIDLFHNVKKQNTDETSKETIASKPEKITKNQSLQFIGFSLAGKEYAVNILYVNEIRMDEKITPLPNVPKYIIGVMNLRGIIVPVIDFGQLLDSSNLAQPINKAILIINMQKGNRQKIIGILVDAVSDTYDINVDDIQALPEKNEMQINKYVRGLIKIKGQLVILLDMEKFFPFIIKG